MDFSTTGCSVPIVAISQLAPPALSVTPNTHKDNTATVPQIIPVTSGSTVYYLNQSPGTELCRRRSANLRFINNSDDHWMTRSCTHGVFCNASNGTYCFQVTRISSITGVLKERPLTRVETGAIQRRSFAMARVLRRG